MTIQDRLREGKDFSDSDISVKAIELLDMAADRMDILESELRRLTKGIEGTHAQEDPHSPNPLPDHARGPMRLDHRGTSVSMVGARAGMDLSEIRPMEINSGRCFGGNARRIVARRIVARRIVALWNACLDLDLAVLELVAMTRDPVARLNFLAKVATSAAREPAGSQAVYPDPAEGCF